MKHLMNIAGVSSIAYYAGHFLFGSAILLVQCGITLIVAAATDVSALVSPNAIGVTLMLFIIYFIQVQAWCWLASFLFSCKP